MAQLVDEMDRALLDDTVAALAKLRVLSLSKDMLTTDPNYAYLMMYQTMVLPWLQGITNFERDLVLEDRASMLFPNNANAPRQEWLNAC